MPQVGIEPSGGTHTQDYVPPQQMEVMGQH
jgi:hypothetical protein